MGEPIKVEVNQASIESLIRESMALLALVRTLEAVAEAAKAQERIAFRIAMTDTQQAVAGQALVSRSHYVEACRATEQAIRALAARPESGDRT